MGGEVGRAGVGVIARITVTCVHIVADENFATLEDESTAPNSDDFQHCCRGMREAHAWKGRLDYRGCMGCGGTGTGDSAGEGDKSLRKTSTWTRLSETWRTRLGRWRDRELIVHYIRIYKYICI